MPSGIYKRKPLSETHKKNIGIGNMGLKRTGLALQHIIKTNQQPWTDKRRKQMAESKIGNKNPMKNKESRDKMIQSKLKNPTRYWLGKKRLNMTGEKNPAWIDGRTPENVKIRNSVESDIWRKNVFVRDRYIDQKTRQIGGKLTVHHVLNFTTYPELRFDVNNGITLSEESHKEFHKKYSKKNNTREQINEFLSN